MFLLQAFDLGFSCKGAVKVQPLPYALKLKPENLKD